MVKALFLGLLAATMCGFASASVPPQRAEARRNSSSSLPFTIDSTSSLPPPLPLLFANKNPVLETAQDLVGPSASPLPATSSSSSRTSLEEEDPASAVRSERSTNLSFTTGAARRIQMFITNRHLQLLPDGTVNGTSDDSSVYTILQRTTVGIGQLKIQGVATCQYLCMDSCGLLYGSREFGDECVFNEMIQRHHYNTYSSTKYSNKMRTLYLALNKRGQPRKVLLRVDQQLGRLSSFTRVLTRIVSPERAEELHPLRHHGGHLCTTEPPTTDPAAHHHRHPSSTSNPPSHHIPRCRKRKKRKKKKKRKCPPNGGGEGGLAGACAKTHSSVDGSSAVNRRPHQNHHRRQGVGSSSSNNSSSNSNVNGNRKCVSGNSDECQRVDVTEKKRQKTKVGDKQTSIGAKKRKHPKGAKGRKHFPQGKTTTTTTTFITTISTTTSSTITSSMSTSTSNTSSTIAISSESPSPSEEVSLDEDYAGESTTFLEYEYSTATETDSAVLFPQPD